MKQYQHYIKVVDDTVTKIKNSGGSPLIFGAGRAGWYILKVLEHYNVEIKGFADNNECKHGEYEGYTVASPESYAEEFSGSHLLLGVFRADTSEILREKLGQSGFENIDYEMDAFLFVYFHSVVKRKCDAEVLANSIHVLFENYDEEPDHYGYTQNGHFVSPFVTSNITQKCSLHCKDCGQLIPYYKSPVDFSVETVVNDIKQYAQAFDVVPEVSLHGGEPLMNKQMAQICEAVATIPNVVFVTFLTNGTILPSTETIRALSKSGASLQQSDYKELSPKQNAIFDLCRDYNVYSDIVYTISSHMWTRSAPTKQHNRSDEENNKVYSECVQSTLCCQLMDGELHRCAHSMHSTRLRHIPKLEGDFIRLDEGNDEHVISNIREFLTRKYALGACDHCDPKACTIVEPAIQLESIHTKKKRVNNDS